MIDMKQIKENVSSKIKNYQAQEETDFTAREARSFSGKTATENRTGSASIGASIRIKGDVTGDENLIIQGQVEGTIRLQGHNVTISKSGKVKANIDANQIIIEGTLEGDMHGDEKVIIRETGHVLGNIVAPRVTLEDGAMFKGSIEMEPRSAATPGKKPMTPSMTGKDTSELKSA